MEETTTQPPESPPPDQCTQQYRDLLDEVERSNNDITAATARRAKAIDDFRIYTEKQAESRPTTNTQHGWTPAVCAEREMLLELVGVLKVSENTVRTLLYESELLVTRLAPTLQSVTEGEISYPHARVIVDNVTSLPKELNDEFERIVLPRAKELTVPQFRKVARRVRESLCPQSSEERHNAALENRTVWLEPGEDGMSMLGATLSAEVAAAIYDRLTSIALGLRRDDAQGDGGDDTEIDVEGDTDADADADDDKRTLAQKRADVFADLMLTGDTCDATAEGTGGPNPNVGHGIRPRVLVTVPVLTLLGKAELPGTLEGYGPIDPATARDLAAHAPSFTRILVHPVSSAILDYDRTTYAVPADLKTVLRVRDEHCRTIGCSRPPSETDQDHTKEWRDGGKTALDNLTLQCRPHHRVKTHTRVRLRTLAGGELEMTMPSGRVYLTRPATRLDQLMNRK
jgi:hypothetical protein